MHSLKELRAENAARRLSNNNRTADDEREQTPLPAGGATSAAGGVAALRGGRALAPLSSGGSIPLSRVESPAEPTADDDDAQQQADREARRRRRLRRRREREQRETDESGKHNSRVNDDNETGVSVASRISKAPEENDGRRAANRGAAMEVGVAGGKAKVEPDAGVDLERKESEVLREGPDRRPSVREGKTFLSTKNIDPDVIVDNSEKAPLSARGAPPNEKPRRNLTPLQARRARIEQQKREEAQREAGFPGQSPRSTGSSQQRENFEAKGDTTSQGGANDVDGRRRADEGDLRRGHVSRGSSRGSEEAKRTNSSVGRTSSGSDNEERTKGIMALDRKSNGIDQSPLAPSGNVADRKLEEGGEGSGDKDYGDHERDVESKDQGPGDSKEPAAAALGASSDDLLEDSVNGDGGRLQVMRSRMKKAGKGLMNKKNLTSSTRRRGKETHDDEPLVRIGESSEGRPEPEGTASSTDTLPDDGGTSRSGGAGLTRKKMGRGSRAADDGGNLKGGPVDDSDTQGDKGARSVVVSENSSDEDSDTGSDESVKEREKKWGRNRDRGSAELPLAADKEVTLGHVVDRKMREMGYIRKPPVDELKNRRSLRDRVAAEEAPEVHFIGEISGAEGFGSGISCRFRVEGGRHWTCLAGLEEGQTHVMDTGFGETFAPWNHPIDLHYTTKSIQGWPRLMLQVWQLDAHGRNVLRGYGFRHLPSTPGFSEISVPCWRPSGTMQEETAAFFLGVTPRLTAEDAVFNRAWDQRCRLVTLPAGTVWIQMSGLFRNMQNQGVDAI